MMDMEKASIQHEFETEIESEKFFEYIFSRLWFDVEERIKTYPWLRFLTLQNFLYFLPFTCFFFIFILPQR